MWDGTGELRGCQRRYVRGRAQSLRPVVQVGRSGITDDVLREVARALVDHELIKVAMLKPPNKKAMAADLASQTGRLRLQDFNQLEQMYGLTYNPRALLWDAEAKEIVQCPRAVFWDFMHCMFSSGGNTQYETNQLALAVQARGTKHKTHNIIKKKTHTPYNKETNLRRTAAYHLSNSTTSPPRSAGQNLRKRP